jgi:hypothetical protein
MKKYVNEAAYDMDFFSNYDSDYASMSDCPMRIST